MTAVTYRIASPCKQSWAAMSGDDRVRHCAACKTPVFNLRDLTRGEIDQLLRTQGRVCARLYQRADGTVLTRDCEVGAAKLRRAVVAGIVSALTLVTAALTDDLFRRAPSEGLSFKDRAVEVENRLRSVAFIGPLIERIDPAPPPVIVGAMLVTPPPPIVPPSITKALGL